MKKIIFLLLLSMVIVFSAEAHKYKIRNTQITISVQTFYDQLSPYGDWIYSSDYGYVWRPYFDNPASFRPYSSGGNWVYTSYGWTWNSNYDWGWATFHYGRWDFDNYLGWTWIPGTEWAPAWVTWGSYNDYWGWAPMGPNIYAQSNSSWYAPDPWWTFVPRNRFYSNDWNRYIYDRPVRVTNITYINNIYVDNSNSKGHRNSWYQGPQVSEVDRYSRSRVQTMKVVDNDRAERTGVHNNMFNAYRPSVDNKSREYRPTEYRSADQARSGRKIEQTSARTNDPGVNRTRDNRTETRVNTQSPADRNVSGSRENRSDPRKSGQVPDSRNSGVKSEPKATPRTNTQMEPNRGSNNMGKKSEPRMGTQVYPERNSNRPVPEPQRETPNRGSNVKSSERNSSANTPARVENNESRQPRNSSPDLQKVYMSPTRESGNRQTPTAQPTREQRTQSAAPAQNSRTQNTETKQTSREDVKKDENRKSGENTERGTSGNPNRR